MLPFYVQNVGIIAGILNIEDNIHDKCGGVFAILANFITFYYIIPPFLPKFQNFQKFFTGASKFLVISPPCLNDKRDWLVQEQTALGKDISNPLTACNLPKIAWFLNSPVSS